MTEAFERRAVAFIRTIANRCMSCLRQSKENCAPCASRWANEIMRDYLDKESPEAIDYSLRARQIAIVDALQRAGRPLHSSEIDLKDICTKQLKYWTLRKMVRRGEIGRKVERVNGRQPSYVYFVAKK